MRNPEWCFGGVHLLMSQLEYLLFLYCVMVIRMKIRIFIITLNLNKWLFPRSALWLIWTACIIAHFPFSRQIITSFQFLPPPPPNTQRIESLWSNFEQLNYIHSLQNSRILCVIFNTVPYFSFQIRQPHEKKYLFIIVDHARNVEEQFKWWNSYVLNSAGWSIRLALADSEEHGCHVGLCCALFSHECRSDFTQS